MTYQWAHGGILCGIVTAACLLGNAAFAASQYAYDSQGRLKTVTDENGATAEYVYDAVGNLLEVRRFAVNELTLTSFSPTSGPVGTTVTLQGSGFDPTAIGNSVSFNGVGTAVSSASTTRLIVEVPTGATTGQVGVAVGAQSALSIDQFTVTASDGAPTIAGFTPKCALADQSVSLTGTNFDTSPGATRVEVGSHIATATIHSTTTLSFLVPRSDIGGRIRVITALGTAESADPLAIWPSAWNCTTFVDSHWIDVDAPETAIVLPANQQEALFFSGVQGQLLSFQISGLAPTTATLYGTLVRPDGYVYPQAVFGSSSHSYHLPALTQDGTYSFRLRQTTATTNVNVQLQSNPLLAVDGAGFALYTEPKQSRRVGLVIDDTDKIGIGVYPFAITPANANATAILYKPDGGNVPNWLGSNGSCSGNGPGCHLNVAPDLAPGTYTIVWRPASTATAPTTGTIWASNDHDAMLVPGVSSPVNLTRNGQNARLQFAGEAGSGVTLSVSSVSFAEGASSLGVYVTDPTGANVTGLSANLVTDTGKMITVPVLPSTGTYTLLLDPNHGGTSVFEATLDPGTPLIVDGPPINLSTTSPGRGFRLLIDGVKHQKLGIGILNLAFDGWQGGQLRVKIYAPEGTLIGATSCSEKTASQPGCEIDLGPLPIAGRYALTFEPPSTSTTTSFDVQASNDIEVPLSGTPQDVVVARDGGNARLTFQGIPGAGQTVLLTGLGTVPISKSVGFAVKRSDDEPLNTRTPLYSGIIFSDDNNHVIKMGDFPFNSTYTVFVDPQYAVRAQLQASITSGVDVMEPAPGGGQVSVHKDVVVGPWARSAFTAIAGDDKAVGVDLLSLTNPSGNGLSLSVLDPEEQTILNGTQTVSNCSVSVGGCDFDLPDLLLPGGYQVLAELPADNPADAPVLISTTDDIVINGTSATFNLSTRGQNGRLIFNAAAGSRLRLTLTRVSPPGQGHEVTYKFFAPDGSEMLSTYMSGSQVSTTQNFETSVAGAYTLYLDPSWGYATTLTASIAPY